MLVTTVQKSRQSGYTIKLNHTHTHKCIWHIQQMHTSQYSKHYVTFIRFVYLVTDYTN